MKKVRAVFLHQSETKSLGMPLAFLLSVLMLSAACDTQRKPSYEELKAQNEELESQLASVNEKIHSAQSELEDLKSKIEEISYEPCHEDSASDLSGSADSIESDLDDAENESK